jgi:flagellar basal-body rod modification protein FlgD
VITPITPVASFGTPTQTKPTEDSMGDKDMFMKMLVAQLKYQNPMQPTDGGQYMSQMAVFAQVEKLGQLVDAQKTQQAWQEKISAESLVGKQVTGTGSDKASHSGIVTSVALDGDSPTLTLADGSTVAVGDVSSVEQQQ